MTIGIQKLRIIETRPALVFLFVAGMGVAALCGLVYATKQSEDEQRAIADAVTAVNRQMTLDKQKADAQPRVILVGDNYECKQFHIRPKWELAVAQKCKELAQLLEHARTIP